MKNELFAASALLMLAVSACGPARALPTAAGAPRAATRAEPQAATPSAAVDEVAREPGIRWLRDDPDAAFARARSEHQLVVVDLWAAWCHTCLSMQKFVLTDAKLPGAGARFVFLAIDGDRSENADFLRRFPTSGWPTFYVLSPVEPTVRGRWLGAASPGQFARFLADAEHAPELADDPKLGEARRLRTAADTLAGDGRHAEAAAAYADALAHAPVGWERAPDVRVARASALLRAGNPDACVDMAFDPSFSEQSAPISTGDLAASLLDCAERLPAADPRRRRARESAEARLSVLCENGAAELTPDDRGDACGTLIAARDALGDASGAHRAAETRLALLEEAARGMPDEVALIYDPARTETLVLLGRGDEAVSLLEARQRALPDNYNPPHQLARVDKQLQKWDAGLAAIERALALAYGPRRATLHTVKVDLLLGAGRRSEARAVLAEQIAALTALPEGEKRPEAERTARERLRTLSGRPR